MTYLESRLVLKVVAEASRTVVRAVQEITVSKVTVTVPGVHPEVVQAVAVAGVLPEAVPTLAGAILDLLLVGVMAPLLALALVQDQALDQAIHLGGKLFGDKIEFHSNPGFFIIDFQLFFLQQQFETI